MNMIVKIIESLLLLGLLFVMALLFYKFIVDTRLHRKRMNKLDQWSQFHNQLMEWSSEIVDTNVRVNFMNGCVHKLISDSNDHMLYNDMLDDWSVEEEKQKIYKEWGQHIPSLLQEMREKKLNKIL